jgi:oxygen-independent coproporphyrinogen-3 oxidase
MMTESKTSADVLTSGAARNGETGVGSYFISNYPPYSFWKPEQLPAVEQALDRPPEPGVALGLYLHIPFCRKRCKFCYFRVYTDKNAREVEDYLKALGDELALYQERPLLSGRPLRFVYFGGGTPSFISSVQLETLVERLQRSVSWDDAEEVTFECEPGTLSLSKLETLKRIGVTRVSLGVENWNDDILSENGRAHLSQEILRAWEWIQQVSFPSVNLDLIAGMVGETGDTWADTVDKTIALRPDSVTIYQMELPFNTEYSREIRVEGKPTPVPTWEQKRAWVRWAFEKFERAGYAVSSGYTLVEAKKKPRFSYRDNLWHGADMLGTGVASFSHVAGVHFQNQDRFDDYLAAVGEGKLPLSRALPLGPRERLIRELILQMKLGRLDAAYFREKFQREILVDFAPAFRALKERGYLDWSGDAIELTRDGLLRVDSLLPSFFPEEHRAARYT